GVELASIGRTGGDAIDVVGEFNLPISEVRAAWSATLPAILDAV
ncbi:MAG: Phosphoribosylformylglycinamidine synthase subunit PurL, partial [Nocardioidaceae bacterium]|nr:Phosphoribosylformylglycinamidine synthase subunit PurL [Nocardioidaceae bacterium]